MSDKLLNTFRSEIPFPDEITARRIHRRVSSRRPRLPRRHLILAVAVVAAIAAPAAVLGSGIISRPPSPESVARHLQRQFTSYVAEGARQDPGPRFARARRAIVLRLIERNSTRFHYRVKRVSVLPGRDGAPLVIVRAPGSLIAFSRSVGALERILDPVSKRPRITDGDGARIDHTKWEAFFLEAVDRDDVPVLVVWNAWRQPQGGGGQWAREESLLPFLHG